MSARDDVLARVRRALGSSPDGGTGPAAAGHAAAPSAVPRAYRVAGTASGRTDLVDLLAERLEDYRATVLRCDAAQLPAVLAEQLADAGSVVVPPGLADAWTAALPPAGDAEPVAGAPTGTTVRRDSADAPLSPADLDATAAVLTACRVAVAETGTLVLDGEPDQGRRVLTLLPDRHVVVVRAEQVVGSVPEAVRLLAEHPERPLTWISGPSATSDIELVRVEGVHGPRDLRVVLVG